MLWALFRALFVTYAGVYIGFRMWHLWQTISDPITWVVVMLFAYMTIQSWIDCYAAFKHGQKPKKGCCRHE